MKYKKTTLSNGLRVVTVPTPGNPSVTVLVVVETGANYESKSLNGLSHFLEHMCFKGTTKRPSSMVINKELDGLGAHTNAFTTHELTGYHAKAGKKQFKKIMDVISDMYLDPTFPESDLEIERGVIIEEIRRYEDRPQNKIWNVFMKMMYGDTPAGRPIIGTIQNIKKFKRKDFVDYRKTHYVAKKTIVVVAGDVSEKMVLGEVRKHFKDIPKSRVVSKDKVKTKQKSPKILIENKDTEQNHMIFGFHAFTAMDKRLPATALLSTILGEGMSSRLWHKLREEMGACYDIRSLHEEYTDHGIFAISTGINASRTEEVSKAVLQECKKLTEELVTNEELEKAKEYRVGHLYMELETTDNLAEFYADQEVTTSKLKTPQEIEREIRKVTSEDVRRVAQEIFRNDNLNLAIIGHVRELDNFKKSFKL